MSSEINYVFNYIAEGIQIDLRSPIDLEILPSDTGRMYLVGKDVEAEDVTLTDSETAALTYETKGSVGKKLLGMISPTKWNRALYLYVPEKQFASVKIGSAVGNIRLCGLNAVNADISCKLGNISVKNSSICELVCYVGNGNIGIEETRVTEKLACKTDLGNVSAKLIGRDYSVSASSKLGNVSVGDTDGAGAAGGIPVTLESSCGNVRAEFTETA